MKTKGIILTILSAVIYGITPAVGRLTYAMGSNGTTLAFYRYLFSLPLLLFVAVQKEHLRPTMKQIIEIGKISLGVSLTSVLLYSSYSYIGVGTATTIHFLYPLCISLAAAFFYHEKMEAPQILCLILCTAGIFGFLEKGGGTAGTGILLAAMSSLSFACYMLGFEHSVTSEMPLYTFTFIISVMVVLQIGIIGVLSGTLVLRLPAAAYGCSAAVGVAASVFATVFLQTGIRVLGAPISAVLSMFEPVTSLAVGYLILGEEMNGKKAAGCAAILCGITYLIFYNCFVSKKT